MNTDRILISNLKFEAPVGVYNWEHGILQPLELDLELVWDLRAAAARDDLRYTLNYAAISEQVIALAQSQHHALIETLAEKIAAFLIRHYQLPQLTLTLRKPTAVPQANSVGVRLQRRAADYSASKADN